MKTFLCLTARHYSQSRTVNDLVIHSKLAPLIMNNQNTHTPTTIVVRRSQPLKQTALIKHRQTLLNIARLSHSHDAPVITDVQHAVLLEHGAEHVLHHDRGRGVRDKRRLLVQLLAEQVHAHVPVLARVRRRRDADHLAWPPLQHQQVADADVVAWDRDRVGRPAARNVACAVAVLAAWGAHADLAVFDDDVFFAVLAVVMVMAAARDGVQDAVGGALDTVAERVVVSVFVVVSHVTAVVLGWINDRAGLGSDLDVLLYWCLVVLLDVLARVRGLVLPTRGVVLFGERCCALTVVSFKPVKLDLTFVSPVFDVDLGVDVAAVGLSVSERLTSASTERSTDYLKTNVLAAAYLSRSISTRESRGSRRSSS